MIPAVILAAGASTRMGRRSKALLPIGDKGNVFVTRLLGTLYDAGLDDLVVVVGPDGAPIRDRVETCGFMARVVENPHPERGQLSSLLAALDLVDRPGVRAMMAIPVDMPLVAPATVRVVRLAALRTSALVVRPAREGRHGHPVVFARALFDELRRADPSRGARAVVAAHADRVFDVEVEDDGAFVDIDTPEDYERYVGTRLA